MQKATQRNGQEVVTEMKVNFEFFICHWHKIQLNSIILAVSNKLCFMSQKYTYGFNSVITVPSKRVREQLNNCRVLLDQLHNHDDSDIFLHPVNASEVRMDGKNFYLLRLNPLQIGNF